MSLRNGFATIFFFLICLSSLQGQTFPNFDPPAPFKPKKPPTEDQRRHYEALEHYIVGLVDLQQNRIFEALRAFAKATELDPQAAPAFKAQIPILLALDETAKALTVTKKTLEIDPDDHEVWYAYAGQLKSRGENLDARRALRRSLAALPNAEHTELRLQIYLDLGLLLEDDGQHLPAAKAFNQAARLLEEPEALTEIGPISEDLVTRRLAEIYERIGRLYVHAGKYNEAVDAYHRSQQKYPEGSGRLNYNLAQVYSKQGKLAKALAALDSYLRYQPQGAEAYVQRIEILQKLKRDDEIVPWLERTSKADPHNITLKQLLAKNFHRYGRLGDAERLYQQLLVLKPSSELYVSLLRLYLSGKDADTQKGLKLLDETIAKADALPVFGDNGETLRAKAMVDALRANDDIGKSLVQVAQKSIKKSRDAQERTYLVLAALAAREKSLATAERFYRLCLGRKDLKNEHIAYGGLLQLLWKQKKYKEVIVVCRQGLRDAPKRNHILLHHDLARALTQFEQYDEALFHADQAIDLAPEPDRLASQHLRMRVLIAAKRFEQAEAGCLAMLEEHKLPSDVREIRYLMSVMYSAAGKLAKAEKQLQLVLSGDPDNATANNDLGYIWADQGKHLEKAESMIRKALQLDRERQRKNDKLVEVKDRAAYVDSLGWVLFKRGKLTEALRELERATELPGGDDPVIWDHLGDVYFQLKEIDRAAKAWRKALHLYDAQKRRRIDQKYKDIRRKLATISPSNNP